MTDQADRYDRMATGYARWWAPVLAPAVAQLLDDIAPRIGTAGQVVDIGTGTGQLALGAIGRWPRIHVTGVDASVEMIAVADAEADRMLSGSDRTRFRSVVASADAMPLPDAAADLAMSSFVFQLVPRRARALREARRVLRPGGWLAYVTWLEDARAFLPDIVFDEVLDDLGIGARPFDGRSGDLPSVERAAVELRRAGFAGVSARQGSIEHRFGVDDYIAFLSEFDEETLFDDLTNRLRDRLMRELATRLRALTPHDMTMRVPIVFAAGRRSR